MAMDWLAELLGSPSVTNLLGDIPATSGAVPSDPLQGRAPPPQPPAWAMPAPANNTGPSVLGTAQNMGMPITGSTGTPPAPAPASAPTPPDLASGPTPPGAITQPDLASGPTPPGAITQPQPPGSATLPPNSTPTIGGPQFQPAPAQLPPISVQAGAPVGANQSGGLASALGLTPESWRSTMAGLGKGLSAVGHQRPGTFAGAAFAGGLGGALEGSTEQQNKTDVLNRQKQNDEFTQNSTLINDKLAERQQETATMLAKSRAAMYDANAGAKTAGGGGGSNSWWLTDTGKLHMAETETQKWYDGQMRGLQMRKGLASEEDLQKSLAALDERREKTLKENYKKYGVDPEKADKIRTMGDTPDNPFFAPKMTPQIFDATVGVGQRYHAGPGYKEPPPRPANESEGSWIFTKANDGKFYRVYRRTAPPGGQQQQQPVVPSAPAMNDALYGQE